MTLHPCLFSSASDDWATPQAFFDKLHTEFQFTLDPCSDHHNAKCSNYYTKDDDGLTKDWGTHTVFCNPPYGRISTGAWAKKAYDAAQAGATVVLLVPSRTDTRWFHNWIYGKAEIRFVRGRLKFGTATTPAPFGSLVAVYRPPHAATATSAN